MPEVLPFEREQFSAMALPPEGYQDPASFQVEKLKYLGYPFPTQLVERKRERIHTTFAFTSELESSGQQLHLFLGWKA